MSEEQEIEVTPEMIRAGEEVLAKYDDRFDSKTDLVRDLYLAVCATLNRSNRGAISREETQR